MTINFNIGLDQFPNNDANALKQIVEKLKLKKDIKILEIGCWAGKSTSILANFVKDYPNSHVWVVDWFKGSPGTAIDNLAKEFNIREIFENNMKELGLFKYINIIENHSALASLFFRDNFFDMIFIDGDHRYFAIKKDLDIWFPKLKKEGIFSGHDCEMKFQKLWEIYFNSNDKESLNLLDKMDLGKIDTYKGVHLGVIKALGKKFHNNIEIMHPSKVWWKIK